MGWDSRKWGLPEKYQHLVDAVAKNLRKSSVWQPILKNVLANTIAIILAVIPSVVRVYGTSTYLGAMVAAFGQPGQRFGKMVETLFLIALGTLLGLGWGNLGLYLSSLVYADNVSAAWAIRGIFFTAAVILHGVLRSSAPRLFQLILFFALINLTVLTSAAKVVTLSAFTTVVYPIFSAIGVVVLVNVTILPQFSSSFLGTCTIEALTKTIESFQKAGDWFMSHTEDGEGENSPEAMRARLATLTDEKPKLRASLGSCKATQAESNFELALAVLPPSLLKPISVTMMTRLVQVTISLINACESKSALEARGQMNYVLDEEIKGKADGSESDTDSSSDVAVAKRQRDIDLIKPIHELESGDIDALEHIMSQIRQPAKDMHDQIQDAVNLITYALAYCYDVSELPSKSAIPHEISLPGMDARIEMFTDALAKFDVDSAAALETAAAVETAAALEAAAVATDDGYPGHIAPRMETHLAASFLISISRAARHVLEMLQHARTLVERRQSRHGRRSLYFPRISWKKWLVSGGEKDYNVLPESARKEARAGHGAVADSKNGEDESADETCDTLLRPISDEESGASGVKKEPQSQNRQGPCTEGPRKSPRSNSLWIRGLTADAFEFFLDSDHLRFALKMAVAALLVTWPAFVPSLNPWYVSVRGTWATLQLIIVFEVAIGTSFRGFFLRALGTIYGCSVGLIAWEIGQGNIPVLVVILTIGLLPAGYVQVATPYVKAGVIAMVSLSVVGIATVVRANDDLAWQVYVKRLICFLVGGAVALLIELSLFPVRARDRLVESLASTISQVSVMGSFVAVGVDSPNMIDAKSQTIDTNFRAAKEKAEQALEAARTFLPFCLTEPRIKGTFKDQELVYDHMINVLSQIIDRLDNMINIRKLFGSTVLKELHAEILPYRRNVSACVALTLFAVQEALVTKLPLPQFLPSSRLAQLRYIARTRELLIAHGQVTQAESDTGTQIAPDSPHDQPRASSDTAPKLIARQDFLAWKAAAGGLMEIVEYLEELANLAKLLVGINAFLSGLLESRKVHDFDAARRARESKAAPPGTKTMSGGKTGINRDRDKSQSSTSFLRRSSVALRGPSAAGLRKRRTSGTSSAAVGSSTLGNDGTAEGDDIPESSHGATSKRVGENDRSASFKTEDSQDSKGKSLARSSDDLTATARSSG
ncbi:hypothetical protein F4861DRAFT_521815 [Xylaria intraflava]|nr:hypothetical protein F4861DRAFT_521815 [Xylaria intraflava]